MNTWISEGVKARHWTCNVLLAIIFVPLVLLDLLICFAFAFEGGLDNGFLIADGLLAAVGAYGLVLHNRTGGLWLGLCAVITLIAVICIDDVGIYNFEYDMDWTIQEKFYRSLFDTIKWSAIWIIPFTPILAIRKKGISAWKNLEQKGVFTKLSYELIPTIIICLGYIAYHVEHYLIHWR